MGNAVLFAWQTFVTGEATQNIIVSMRFGKVGAYNASTASPHHASYPLYFPTKWMGDSIRVPTGSPDQIFDSATFVLLDFPRIAAESSWFDWGPQGSPLRVSNPVSSFHQKLRVFLGRTLVEPWWFHEGPAKARVRASSFRPHKPRLKPSSTTNPSSWNTDQPWPNISQPWPSTNQT